MKHRKSGCSALAGIVALACALAGLASGCGYNRLPEERTDDGLVRVPSRSVGGVYRNPDASYSQYKRVMLEPVTIDFVPEWRRSHPEVTDVELNRLQREAVELFREEFVRVFVERGPYQLAETREADVLVVYPRVLDLNIPAPDRADPGTRTYSPQPVKMQINGEVRDGISGTLLLRVIMFEGKDRYAFNELRLANRTSNAHEMGLGFGKWSRLVREAIDVAKASRPASDLGKQ